MSIIPIRSLVAYAVGFTIGALVLAALGFRDSASGADSVIAVWITVAFAHYLSKPAAL